MDSRSDPLNIIRKCAAILCVAVLLPGNSVMVTAQAQQPAAAPSQAAVKIPADQLDSLVAPIALYPDPLLSQTLVASTYPLEIVQFRQWLDQNKNLKDKALAEARKDKTGIPASRPWPLCPMWSSNWRTTSSGPPTLETPFLRSRVK